MKQKQKAIEQLLQQGNHCLSIGSSDAIQCFKKVLKLDKKNIIALNNLGCLYANMQEFSSAKQCFTKLVAINDKSPDVHNNLANIFEKESNFERAEYHYRKAIQLKPDFIMAHGNLGLVLWKCGALSEAIDCFKAVVKLNPNDIAAIDHLGGVLMQLSEFEQAGEYFKQALALNPNYVSANFNLAKVCLACNQLEDAKELFAKTMTLCQAQGNPMLHGMSQVNLIYAKICQADWSACETLITEMVANISRLLAQGAHVPLEPFQIQAIPCPLAFEDKVVAAYAHSFSALTQSAAPFEYHSNQQDKIKIGYLSPDFRTHAVGLLLRENFKYHDREQFEVTCYNLKKAVVDDNITIQIQQNCDHFVDLTEVDDYEAAEKINQDKIDILIDLAGYTRNARPGILALQPAPHQCHWLGSGSSLQAPFIQYFIADPLMVPESLQPSFQEKLLYPKETYCATAPFDKALPKVTREQFHLPAKPFIFFCHTTSYRLEWSTFSAWMGILKACPESILWLSRDNEQQANNFLAFAESAGVEPNRIVFMESAHLTDTWHHQLADLWLDTTIYSSATGVFLALWAGVPMLTCCATGSNGRKASALLTAAKLKADLVTDSRQAYIDKAIYYYQNREALQKLRERILQSRDENPLFKPQAFMQSLESCFLEIMQQRS